jgi:predicted small metal-binding protein
VSPASGWGHVIRAETEEEALRLAGEHAVKVHNLQPTPELIAMVRKNIQTE